MFFFLAPLTVRSAEFREQVPIFRKYFNNHVKVELSDFLQVCVFLILPHVTYMNSLGIHFIVGHLSVEMQILLKCYAVLI